MSFLATRGLSLGAKGRLYSTYVGSITLYRSETWPVKEEDVVGLERIDARIVRLMCNVKCYLRYKTIFCNKVAIGV